MKNNRHHPYSPEQVSPLNCICCGKEIEILYPNEILPEDIQSEAMRWGLDDSVVRDNIYVWLQKNKKD